MSGRSRTIGTTWEQTKLRHLSNSFKTHLSHWWCSHWWHYTWGKYTRRHGCHAGRPLSHRRHSHWREMRRYSRWSHLNEGIQEDNRCIRSNTDCERAIFCRHFSPVWRLGDERLIVIITPSLSLTYKWGRYPWGRYTWIRWRMGRTIISLRWRLPWTRDTTES